MIIQDSLRLRSCDIHLRRQLSLNWIAYLPTPYHPVPLTVTSKNHSMLTAEGRDRTEGRGRKVSRNSSHFKEFLSDEPGSSLSNVDMPSLLPSPMSASQEDTGPVLVDPNSSARTPADPQLRRSTRVSKPPKKLIQEI